MTALTLADGSYYAIRYGDALEGNFQSADIAAPDSSASHVTLHGSNYSVTSVPRKAH